MIEKLRTRISQIFGFLLIIIIIISDSYWEYRVIFITGILFLIGIVLVGIGSLGRLWCSLYIAGYKTDRLIILGPYSMCRNPLYFFNLIGGVGVGFISETFTIPLIILTAFLIYYPFVIKSEEAELKGMHKNEFKKYFDHVPRFFPKLSYLKEPEEYIVKPIVFKKHIFDALWFIWLIGIIETIEKLHEAKIFPIMFHLY